MTKMYEDGKNGSVDSDKLISTLSQAIGRNCEEKNVSIDEKMRVAHVQLDDLNATTRLRVRLAQQLTGLHIMRR